MFTEGDASLDVSDNDYLRLGVKSIALIDQAARLASRTRASRESQSNSSRASALRREARALSAGLPQFIDTLLPTCHEFHRQGLALPVSLVFALTLVHGASMELHSIDAMFDPGSYDAMLKDAMAIAELAHEAEAVDPIPLGPVIGVSNQFV